MYTNRKFQWIGKLVNGMVILMTVLSQFSGALSTVSAASNPNPAAETLTGDVSGTVFESDGTTPYTAGGDVLICLAFYDSFVGGSMLDFQGCYSPGIDGTYSITALPVQDYIVWMQNSSGDVYEYYNETTVLLSAMRVTITAGATTETINFSYEIPGCTDPLANNYNALAEVDDGSCSYDFVCTDSIGCVTISPTDPVHIAYALTTSGGNVNLGIDARNGVEIAIDDAGGEILGHTIQFDGQDESCNFAGGEAAGTALAADPSILAVVGTSCSSAARGAMPLLSAAGMAMVSPSNTLADLTEAGNPNQYPGYLRTIHNDLFQGAAAAQFAYTSLGLRTAATFVDGSDYSGFIQAAFVDEFIALGGSITEQHSLAEGDLATIMTDMALVPPDLIYFPVFMPGGGDIIKQVHATPGLESVTLLGSDSLFTPQVFSYTGDFVEGFLVTGLDASQYSPAYESSFLPAYKAKFGSKPVSVWHAQAYDAFMMIKSAIEKVAVVDPDGTLHIGRQALRDALYGTTDFAGLTGSLTCTATGDCADPALGAFRYHAGQEQPRRVWPTLATAKVGLIVGSGLAVNGYYWLINEGLLQAETDFGIDGTLYEPISNSATDYINSLQQCVDEGNSVCIASWDLYAVIETFASANPEVTFALIDSPVGFTADNLRGVTFNSEQVGYLAGALAGKMTTSNLVGDIGGMEIPGVTAFTEAYRNGAQCANPDVQVLLDYTGNFINPDDGAAMAGTMIGLGADVIFAAAGQTGNGAILYAAQQDVWSIGVDMDEYLTTFENGLVDGSDKLLSSALKQVDMGVYQTIEDYLYGSFTSGNVSYGLGNGGVNLAPYHETDSSIPVEVKDYIDGLKAAILAGSINVNYDCRADYNPAFAAYFPDNKVQGYHWLLGSKVNISIDDPDTGPGEDYTDAQPVVIASKYSNQTVVVFSLDGFTLKPGQVITMTDGFITKTHTVNDLTITEINVDTDIIAGTVEPGTYMRVDANYGPDGYAATLNVTVNEFGDWSADFSGVIGGDIAIGSSGEVVTSDIDGDNTVVKWRVVSPFIEGNPDSNWVHARDWPEGTLLTLTITDPDTLEQVYSTTATIGQNLNNTDDPNDILADFDLGGFDLKPGHILHVTDGASIPTERTYTILNLAISGFDVDADTVSGVSNSDLDVEVGVHLLYDKKWLYATPVAGNWTADFSGTGGVDLVPGSNGWALQRDAENNTTQVDWYIPNPFVEANLLSNRVQGRGWVLGSTITLSINDPQEYSSSTTFGQNPENPGDPNDLIALFNLNGLFTLQAGDVVSLTDGVTTRSLTVSSLAISGTDPVGGTVSGTAEPGAQIHVWACTNKDCANRYVGADELGNWQADFSSYGPPPDDQFAFALIPGGTNGGASISDSLGNQTWAGWNVRNPRFDAWYKDGNISAYDWPLGTTLTLEIDAYPGETFTTTVGTAPWDPNQTYGPFNLYGLVDIQPGMTISISGAGTTKTLLVSDLDVTGMDAENDIISGTAGIDQPLWMNLNNSSGDCCRNLQADGSGNWSVDYSLPGSEGEQTENINPGSNGTINAPDEDGDNTSVSWQVPNPNFSVRANVDQVEAWEWPLGANLSLTIHNPFDPESVDYTDSATVMGPTGWGDPRNYVNFYLYGNFDIQPGFEITLTDGITIKTHTVTDLAFTDIDLVNDTVTGVGKPSSQINIWACDQSNCYNRYLNTDEFGDWFADFGNPGPQPGEGTTVDLKGGTWIDSSQWDEDNDSTMYGVNVPNPRIETSARDDWAQAREWPLGTEVTLTIDDPSNGVGVDFTAYATMAHNPGNPGDPNDILASFYMAGFDIQPNFLMSMSANDSTKTLVVSEQHFTSFDYAADTVSGHAEANINVNVWACDNSGCYNRHVSTDNNGDWLADFGVYGKQSDEQNTFDIMEGSWVDSSVNDEDGDSTSFGENATMPGFSISGTVRGQDWHPITGVSVGVTAQSVDTGDLLLETCTDPFTGQYYLSGLPLDTPVYVIANWGMCDFSGNGSVYYPNASIPEAATPITLTSGIPDVGGVDISLGDALEFTEFLKFNFNNPILSELAVRQAIAYGIDREAILQQAFLPNGQFGDLQNTYDPAPHWASAPDKFLTLYLFDPELARSILETAGWVIPEGGTYREKDGVTLTLTLKTTNFPARVDGGSIFQQNMADIGIQLLTEFMFGPDFFAIDGPFYTGNFEIAEYATLYCTHSEDETCVPTTDFKTGDPYNVQGYSSAAADQEYTDAQSAANREERKPHAIQHQVIISQDLPVLPLFTRISTTPEYTPTGLNWKANPNGEVSVVFDEVAVEGFTSATPIDFNPANLPSGFSLVGSVQSVGTSAVYTTAQVCLAYLDTDLSTDEEALLKLYHYADGTWTDVTDPGFPNTTYNMICGTGSSLSPFAVFLPDNSLPRHGGLVDEVDMYAVDGSTAIPQIVAGKIDLYSNNLSKPEDLQAAVDANLNISRQYSVSYSITYNPAGPVFSGTGKLNPFASARIREASNMLYDREAINQQIYGGISIPKWLPLETGFPDYAKYVDIARALEAKYAYNVDAANAIITPEMEALGATLVAGKWNYNGEPVVLIFLIRTDGDGTRLLVGNYIADQWESIGFTVDRQYKTSPQASPLWLGSDPNNGTWHMYTSGWGLSGISRDDGANFQFYYTAESDYGFSPLWQAYTPSPEFSAIADTLAHNNFASMTERRDLFETALQGSMELSYQAWLINMVGFSPYKQGVEVGSDLGAGIDINRLWPYTLRYTGSEGGTIKWGSPDLFIDPPNPVAGSNWTFDTQWQNSTGDAAVFSNPFTGLLMPQRLESAEVYVEAGLPVVNSSDWLTLDFVPGGNVVPTDAWINWDLAAQDFITVGEQNPAGLTARSKVVLHFPVDMLSTVFWQDGSPLSPADFILPWIEKFELGTPGSPIYDTAQVAVLDAFKSSFRGIRFVSYDPLVVEYYSDNWVMDAENNVPNIWPTYNYGDASWQMMTVANLAEASGEIAYSADKSVSLGVEWTNFIAGPSLAILDKYLDQAISDTTIPYPNVLGSLITSEEAAARFNNLKNWYKHHGHFWVGTGPYYLDKAYFYDKSLVLKQNPRYVDLSDRWLTMTHPKLATVTVDDPGPLSTSSEATFEIWVNHDGSPYPLAEIKHVTYLLFGTDGGLVETGLASPVADGHFQVTLSAGSMSGLLEGVNRLDVAVVPIPVVIPAYASREFSVASCYTLSFATNPSGPDYGSVAPSPIPNCNAGTQYLPGTVVQLTATPAEGYNFSYWSGDLTSMINPDSITMNLDKSVTANFIQIPTNVQASDGTYTNKVLVTWTAASGATSYKVYRGSTATVSDASLLGGLTVTTFNDTTATPGLTYYYWVKACKGPVCSDYSSSDTGWRGMTAPTNVAASDGTFTDKTQVTWTASSGATSYNVYRATTAGGAGLTLLGSPTDVTFDDTTGTPGITYYYMVKACNGAICSGYSAVNSGWRNFIAPTDLLASDGTYTNRVTLTWTAASGATSYQVYRGSTATVADASLLGSPIVTTFNDTTATAGLTYYYWVKACSGANCSDYSLSDTGWRNLLAPANVAASDGTFTDKVQVTWTAAVGATSYNVYRATTAGGAGLTLLGSPTD
jgi:peptide/nickel transport system substrate-binding protein